MREAVTHGSAVLPWQGVKPWILQIGMIVTAVVLPAAAHLMGAPVRWLLPMHWPIIFAGLLYGWRAGLIVGVLAPLTNWILTGYPILPKMIAMTVELGMYGFAIGLLREKFKLNGYLAILLGLIAGRLFFIIGIVALNAYGNALGFYLKAAMTPGLAAGLLQIMTIPLIVKQLMRKSEDNLKYPL